MDAHPLKILAIDDTKDNLTSLQAVLKDALPGCTMLTALNGADGIRLAHAEDPDVILLDIVMPGMDGYAVCTTVKADDDLRTIPVIFLTALRTDRASRMKALEVGADGFLAKPLDEHELLVQIRTMAKLKVANRLQRLDKEKLAELVVERTAQLEAATVSLRASEARYHSVFTDSRVVKLLIDPADGRIVEGNRAACEYYGWDQPRLQTMFIQDINALTAADVSAEMERTRTMRKTHFDFRHRLANGDVRDVEVYSSPVPPTEPGGRVLLYSIVHDVTERRRAEAMLRDEQERMRTVLDTVADPIFVKDNEHRVILANRAFHSIFGLEDDAVIGRTLAEHVSTDERQQFLAVDRRVLDTGIPDQREEPMTVNGVTRTIVTRKARFVESTGERFLVGSIHDITERKQAESELRKRARALEQSPASVVITDHLGNIEYVNPRFEHVTGYARAEVVGRNPRILKGGQTPAATYAELWQAITAGGEWRGELCNRRKNGELFWEYAAISGLVDESGKVGHYIAVKEDITERKQAEATRVALQEQLTQSQRMESVGLLAGGVAHDFNNQLGVIIGYAELTMLKLGPEHEVHADLAEIHRAARRSADLTRQLLAYARKQTLSPRVLDLNDAIDGMLKMLRRLLGERLTLAWTPENGLWKVAVDPTQIDQVLANLAVNAKSAMRDGDAVLEVSTANVVLDASRAARHPRSREGEFVCLRVHDNGAGMDARTLSRIFEPFFTTKDLGEGTGLGLSTVQGIVEQHGGFVEVESTVGVGTTFHVYFPRSIAFTEEIAEPALPLGRGTETILLVEDEEGVRAATAEMLRMMGYSVLAARDGDEATALSASRAAPIHLLLTDVIMPGLNGVQLRDRLRKPYPELKVLFMSGYPDDIIATEGVLETGIHFVQKPFSIHTLGNAIRRILDD